MAETRVHAARLETWANDIERSLYERQPVEDDRVEVSDMAALRAGAVALRLVARLPQCPECGPTRIDEDGCCAACGADTVDPEAQP